MAQRQLKVLLADDVKLELEIEKTFFQRSGFLVITAADGPKALAIALTQKPDLVILDQVMPGLNGNDVCKLLKARLHPERPLAPRHRRGLPPGGRGRVRVEGGGARSADGNGGADPRRTSSAH